MSLHELLSESALADIRRLELRTARRATAELAGSYRSSFRGRGLTFSDLREYQPGDDTKHIHWKATARTGRVFVKSFEEERSLSVMLALDISGSTAFGTAVTLQRRARELCALVALLASRNHDAAGLCLFSDTIIDYLPPQFKRSQFHRIIATLLTKHSLLTKTDLRPLLHQLRTQLRRRGVVMIVSDFLVEPFEQELLPLALSHDVILVQLPIDFYELSGNGLVNFEDAETGELLTIDSSEIEALQSRIRQHNAKLLDSCRRCGAELIELRSSASRTLIELSERRKRFHV